MNQDQRKFLIERVNKTFKNQEQQIDKELPTKPSLNNYLVAAFLDNSIRFNDIEVLKRKMREAVLRMGTGDVLIEKRRTTDWRNSNKREEDDVCQVNAADLFIIPENYLAALAEYEAKKAAVEEKLKNLESQRDTILLKIQIGSNQVLDKLITQVDNLADLNIMNQQFLLT